MRRCRERDRADTPNSVLRFKSRDDGSGSFEEMVLGEKGPMRWRREEEKLNKNVPGHFNACAPRLYLTFGKRWCESGMNLRCQKPTGRPEGTLFGQCLRIRRDPSSSVAKEKGAVGSARLLSLQLRQLVA